MNIILHSNCSDIQALISFKGKGGFAGKAGTAGEAGEPGTPLSGQQSARQGWNGNPGQGGYKDMMEIIPYPFKILPLQILNNLTKFII